ncbi:hypothetical protein FRC10_005283, partial [Ceratobasidium sp. 414]
MLDVGVHNAAVLRLVLPFPLEAASVSAATPLTRDYLPQVGTLQAIIRAQKTPEELHRAHG